MPVIVLGMHRSGASALARCVNLMGVSSGREQVPTSSAPDDPCKSLEDPRTCLTLPFWVELLPEKPVVLFIHRNPLAIHQSLEAQEGLTKRGTLALWQVYMTHAIQGLAGLPVQVLGFKELIEQTDTCLTGIRSFLERQGVAGLSTPDQAAVDRCLASIPKNWRCADEELLTDEEITDEQKELWAVLNNLPSESDAFVVPNIPGTAALIETLLRANQECAAARLAKLEQDYAWAEETAEERERYIVELERAKAWAMEQRLVFRRLVEVAETRLLRAEQELQLWKAPFWQRVPRRLVERARRSPVVKALFRRLAAAYRGAAR